MDWKGGLGLLYENYAVKIPKVLWKYNATWMNSSTAEFGVEGS